MKKKGKNLVFLLAVIVGSFVFFHFNVNAEEIRTKCGTFVVENEVLKKYYWNAASTNDVVIPDGVKKIGDKAFYMEDNMKSVYIPDSVTEIGYLSFSACDKLEKVTGGENLINIGDDAFHYCRELKDFDFSRKIENIGNDAFYGCGQLEEVDIPGVEEISEGAFGECKSLKKINIGKAKRIREGALSSCESLEVVEGNGQVEYIGEGAFSFCENLEKIELGNNVIEIGDYAFNQDTKLKEDIVITDKIKKIGECAFRKCSSLEKITIPSSIKCIGEETFFKCSSLKEVNIEEGLKEIEALAFYGCNNLREIKIPKSIEELHAGCFGECDKLANIYFYGDCPISNLKFVDEVPDDSIGWRSNKELFYYEDVFSKKVKVIVNDDMTVSIGNDRISSIGNGYYIYDNCAFQVVKNEKNKYEFQHVSWVNGTDGKENGDISSDYGEWWLMSVANSSGRKAYYPLGKKRWSKKNRENIASHAIWKSWNPYNYHEKSNSVPAINSIVKYKDASYRIISDNTVAYKLFTGKGKNVVIPDKIKVKSRYYKVTVILNCALKNNKKIQNITIGKNIKKIGKEAFYNCKKLKKMTVKTDALSQKTVDKNAFKKAGVNNYKKFVVKVPRKKKKMYKIIFIKRGLSKKVKIK